MLLAFLGGGFLEPNPLDYFFGVGIATNIGAALVCVVLGYLWSKTKYWPLHALHVRHDQQKAHLDLLGRSLMDLHEKIDKLSEPDGPASSGR